MWQKDLPAALVDSGYLTGINTVVDESSGASLGPSSLTCVVVVRSPVIPTGGIKSCQDRLFHASTTSQYLSKMQRQTNQCGWKRQKQCVD